MLTKNDILHALSVLPEELNLTYEKALDRVREQVKPMERLGSKVLEWLVSTRRPLSLSEMQHAMGTKPGQTMFMKDNLIFDVHKLASSCAGLVVMGRNANSIRLIHCTAQEYLIKHLTQPHSNIAMICLTYLTFKDLQQDLERDDILAQFPFGAYAARYWGWHYSQIACTDTELHRLALSLLRRERRATDTFILEPSPLDAIDTDPHRHWLNRLKPSGLHVAAHFGLDCVFLCLLDGGSALDCRNGAGYTPLHYAAWSGHCNIIQLHLNRDADIMVVNDENRKLTPLQLAAANGMIDCTRQLVMGGAVVDYNPDSRDSTMPPLHEAITHSQRDTIDVLLDCGADPNLRSIAYDQTPLDCACANIQPAIITNLLQRGASLNEETSRQALLRLHRHNYSDQPRQYQEALAALIEFNVDLNQNLLHGFRILDFELTFGRSEMIQTLLEAGAQPGLIWHADQPAVQRWVDQPWFGQLMSICSKDASITSTDDTVQPTTITKYGNIKCVFTQPQVANYGSWGIYYIDHRPQIVPGGIKGDDVESFREVRPYISLQIPENFVRVTKITIQTQSHDQGKQSPSTLLYMQLNMRTGFTDSNKSANGTYNWSYSWFDLIFLYHQQPEEALFRDVVHFNLNAAWAWKEHVHTWSTDARADPSVAANHAWARANAIWSLRPGDHVLLYARAFFPAWANYVKGAEIRIEGSQKDPSNEKQSALQTQPSNDTHQHSEICANIPGSRVDQAEFLSQMFGAEPQSLVILDAKPHEIPYIVNTALQSFSEGGGGDTDFSVVARPPPRCCRCNKVHL